LNDHEINALAEAFKVIVQEQAVAQQAALAELRAELRFEVAKAAAYREAGAASQDRLMKTIGDQLRDTLPAAVATAAERHMLRMAVDRAVPPTEGEQ
jgi:hypothetical protein